MCLLALGRKIFSKFAEHGALHFPLCPSSYCFLFGVEGKGDLVLKRRMVNETLIWEEKCNACPHWRHFLKKCGAPPSLLSWDLSLLGSTDWAALRVLLEKGQQHLSHTYGITYGIFITKG